MTMLQLTRHSLSSSWWQVEHPPYSPDLALNDFWLFPEIKSSLKGQRFHNVKDIKKMALKAVPQQEF
jgi:histone-lysine N-methyltransferase SETMAR